MKWWHWLVLELLVIFGVISWIYFFPGEFEDDFAKSLIGFVLIYAVNKYRETNWRNKMSENYTVEQNAGENQIESGVVSIGGPVDTFRCWKCGRTLPISERIVHMSNPPKYACKECEGIEKEKQYRPFKDCDELVECWERKIFIPAMQYTKQKVLFRPEIWVKSKAYGVDNLITAFDNDNESIGGSCVFLQDSWFDMNELFDCFTFLDGSVCGVEE